MNIQKNIDVIIVGGSYAGLSAAMSLGRSLRNVLIIDSGLPCNRFTPHSHNFLTQDGRAPQEIARLAREQVLQYDSVKLIQDTVVAGKKLTNGFEVMTASGRVFSAGILVFATGIRDILPDISGLKDCWGISAVHCPYCHGYEVRSRPTAILANGDIAYHYVTLVYNLTRELVILTNGAAEFTEEQFQKLREKDIQMIETPVTALEHTDGKLQNILFNDGSSMRMEALYVRPGLEQHCSVPAMLGCSLNKQGYLVVNQFFETTTEGVYACGDNMSMMRSVASAVSTGNQTGAFINKKLAEEAFV